ncbi:hypothetical protein ACHAW5_006507 [Stephanodiscus triporus]|uniref:Uncharacterized protein n=1 Tax=Stephanodiscus triporus TaxID=2934178 RepID=A0ABD3NNI3_9STRA
MRNQTAAALSIFLLGIVRLRSWSPPPQQRKHARSCCRELRFRLPPSTIFLAADDEGEPSGGGETAENDSEEYGNSAGAVYGVSYIGGDPCGSKYNEDPFDVASAESPFKPGIPDDMKDRIAALARKKLPKSQGEA